MVFPVVMHGCESWTIKKAECWRTDAFELWCCRDSWEFLGLQEIKPVHSIRNQSWIFIWRTDVEAEVLILWPPDAKSWLIGKDPDAGKDGEQEEKGVTEGITDSMGTSLNKLWEMVKDKGTLACCSPWGLKESDTTERLNNSCSIWSWSSYT